MYFYTCEHDCGLYEGSLMDGDCHADGAARYAERCGDVDNPIHAVYVWDCETYDKLHTVILKYEMGYFKVIDITNS